MVYKAYNILSILGRKRDLWVHSFKKSKITIMFYYHIQYNI